MKNSVQPGNTLTVTAPAGGVVSGEVVLVNSLLGIAAFDAAQTEEVEVTVEGVFEVAAKGTDDIGVGATLYWDATAKEMTLTATANTKAGYAASAAGVGVTKVNIRLTPGAA